MKRRTFLQTTVATAGGLMFGIGCANPSSSPDGKLDAGESFSDALTDVIEPLLQPGDSFFPQSIMSGDPTESGVILWTRVVSDGPPDAKVDLELEVSTDQAFENIVELDGEPRLALVAEVEFDHCVRVRVTGLAPATVYFYRFIVRSGGGVFASRTGRTKTAPLPDADVAVRFAYVSCQDYNGRYFNPYIRLLEEELDFIVHLGDYVYETTGNPEFQSTTGRRVIFQDQEEAIVFHSGEETEYHAAKSLSNYRDLYKTYRQDVALQRVHERFPMICIWDDHEFSNDCFGATATYANDTVDETDVARRKAANQAYYEYMPIDYPADPDFRYDSDADFPGDIRIHRDLRFGRHMHLVLTDLRTYRADHVIPEGGFPGKVIATAPELLEVLGEVPEAAAPYVTIETFADGYYETVLKEVAAEFNFSAEDVAGPIGVSFINNIVEELNAASEDTSIPLIEAEAQADLPRGLFYAQTGKGFYSDLGSRFLVVREPFEAICAYAYAKSSGASEETLGPEQEAWFLKTMKESDATWKIWGNEFCLNSLNVDLRSYEILPQTYRQKFSLLVEDWTGMPNRRDKLIDELSQIGNVVVITGDVHAFFAGTPFVESDSSKRLVEFVTGSVSSSPLRAEFLEKASADPNLAAAGAPALAYGIVGLLQDPETKPSPQLAYANITDHGFAVLDVSADGIDAEYFIVDGKTDSTELYTDESLSSQFTTERFRVESGKADLLREIDGVMKRWDIETASWV